MLSFVSLFYTLLHIILYICILLYLKTYNENTCIYPPQDDIDFNDDGIIGAADLVVFLSYYSGEWP